jgi:hypothetical protein
MSHLRVADPEPRQELCRDRVLDDGEPTRVRTPGQPGGLWMIGNFRWIACRFFNGTSGHGGSHIDGTAGWNRDS